MPDGLSFRQRLAGPDGAPTAAARAAVAIAAAAAALLGFVLHGGADEPARAERPEPVAASRLAGEVPAVPATEGPRLSRVASVPALERPEPVRRPRRPRPSARALPVATPEPVATAEPAPTAEATPEPVAPVPAPVVATPPPPPPPAPARPTPARPAPSGETFDSSG